MTILLPLLPPCVLVCRMFHDLLVDLGHAFSAAREKPGGSDAEHGTPLTPAGVSESVSGGIDDGRRVRAPMFHVTEYDVIKGRYPQSWEDHAGASRPYQSQCFVST